ncbi:MAG: C cytochromes biosynthesis protein [Acidobacteria bacterium]|nr:MAG: C cytochromes biosynthesis protein [Acidobacteriota bacterium]
MDLDRRLDHDCGNNRGSASQCCPGSSSSPSTDSRCSPCRSGRLMFHSRSLAKLGLLSITVMLLLSAGDDARFYQLGHKLMCVCSCNQVLLECNHVGCTYSDRMRAELAANLERGDSDDLTLQAFVQKYGPTVLIAPTSTGFNRVAWIMPYLALTLGIATVVLIVRAWKNRPVPVSPGRVAPVTGGELERFREQARRDTAI